MKKNCSFRFLFS